MKRKPLHFHRVQIVIPSHLPKSETRGDCTVVALMTLKGCSYERAFNLMRDVAGRRWRNKDGSKCKRLWSGKFMDSLPKLSGIPWDDGVAATHGSLGKFVESHPKGKYLMWVRNHCFALINGVIRDRAPQSPHRRIFIAYKFR